MKIKDIKAVETLDDLSNLGFGRCYVDISHRGGTLGFYGKTVANTLHVSESKLPGMFGAKSNYLGGGIRGKIVKSNFSPEITGRTKKILEELALACARVYENVENEIGLNTDDDEDPNWEARGTAGARAAGIVSGF